jgi:hypothetical protein
MTVVHTYRGIEYTLDMRGPSEWEWKYYPRLGTGTIMSRTVMGTRSDAEAACKREIDIHVGPAN